MISFARGSCVSAGDRLRIASGPGKIAQYAAVYAEDYPVLILPRAEQPFLFRIGEKAAFREHRRVLGVIEKIQAADDSGCSKVFIPMQNYERIDKEKLNEFSCDIIPVSNVSQVIDNIFPHIKLESA